MGKQEQSKDMRRAFRRAIGDDTAAVWAIRCNEVIKLRGFFGRVWWLLTGR